MAVKLNGVKRIAEFTINIVYYYAVPGVLREFWLLPGYSVGLLSGTNEFDY